MCVPLTRLTTSNEFKLFRFDKVDVNDDEIELIDVTFNMFKSWYLICQYKIKNEKNCDLLLIG